MTMAWTTIESALENSRTAPEIIAAPAGTSAAEIEQMLDRIGAGDAGVLLREAQRARPAERRAKLAACLAVLDKTVAAGGERDKAAMTRLGRRRRDRVERYGDLAQSALLASLIDIELGGEPEIRRARFAWAAIALESYIAAARGSAVDDDTEAQIGRARGVLVRVGGFLRADGD